MNNKITIIFLLNSFFLTLPGICMADWYIGAGMGKTNVDLEIYDTNNTSSISRDYDDTSYKLFSGWKFSRSLALEFGYANLGEYQRDFTNATFSSNTKLSSTALFGGLVGSMKLDKFWKFIGKLGVAYWDTEIKYSNSASFANAGSNTGINPVIGLGFQYQLPKQPFAIRVEWEQYQNIGANVSFKGSPSSTNTSNGQNINSFGVFLSHTL